jgi:hypothetical protein
VNQFTQKFVESLYAEEDVNPAIAATSIRTQFSNYCSAQGERHPVN